MIAPLRHPLGWMVSAFGSREGLILENLALRQQLLALRAKRPHRRLTALHKLFWVGLRRLWAGWKKPLILVTPRTVLGWHRAGFRLYWKWLASRPKGMPKLGVVGSAQMFLIARRGFDEPQEEAVSRFTKMSRPAEGAGLVYGSTCDERHSHNACCRFTID